MTFNADVILHLARYLHPRELLLLSTSCSLLKNLIKYDAVLQSILFHASKSGKKSVNIVIGLLKQGRIHPPSPLRLLRIANGKRCEKKGCSDRVLHVRPDYGLHVCFQCLQLSTIEVSHKRKRDQLAWPIELLEHERTTIGGRETISKYVLDKTFVAVCGEKAGPLVTNESVAPIRVAAEKKALEETRKLGIKKVTPEIQGPIFLALFEEFLSASVDAKNASPSSPACKNLIKWFDRVDSFATEYEEVSKKRKADSQKERTNVKREKAASLFETIRELLETSSVQSWAVEIAMKSPLIYALTHEFRKAPSKLKKKDVAALANTIISFYEPIPALPMFTDYSTILRHDADSNTRFLDNDIVSSGSRNMEFWRLISVIATMIGPNVLINHQAIQTSSHVTFSFYKATLFREAILFKCLPHIEDAFVKACFPENEQTEWISFNNHDGVKVSHLNSLFHAGGVDKEFVASVLVGHIRSDTPPSINEIIEKYGNEWDQVGRNQRVNDLGHVHYSAVESVSREFWRCCGGSQAVQNLISASINLVKNSSDSTEWKNLRPDDDFQSFVSTFSKKNVQIPQVLEDVDALYDMLVKKDDETLGLLRTLLEAINDLADCFTKLVAQWNPYLQNYCRFYRVKCVNGSILTAIEAPNVIDLTSEHRIRYDLEEVLNDWKPKLNTRHKITESLLIYRGMFCEAGILNARYDISHFFQEAVIHKHPELCETYLKLGSALKDVMATIWAINGDYILEQLYTSVPPIQNDEVVRFSNTTTSRSASQWKGKEKSNSTHDALEIFGQANQRFIELLDSTTPIIENLYQYYAQSQSSESLESFVQYLRYIYALEFVLKGDFQAAKKAESNNDYRCK
ncbi:hypothetical protein BCR33DRAFT_769203 [Rhizoclosmatium globosum]|uniref:F-box domain-containing protein n=1 Tax=Rhizoclosmatium globosum TaxID=329046 RepID=A0A1Y2BW90_9FUNG|nr:hypothetical protein BCR33DRAFT_769203 [Rhizoclosmatium globosum]|eukprot:ORY38395.1 hypothetical protein BCR33DRAFT_769203 [Rhizoclosmatium globosum]